MVEAATGNLLEAEAEALVNTVNCVGYMGKGIALQFSQAYPANLAAYQRACEAGEVEPGRMFVHETGALVGPLYIINFPTKRHWRGKSRIEDIEAGLEALVSEVTRLRIRSVAVPPLGCGLGGLQWSRVRPMVEAAFAQVPDVRVLLYAPAGAPSTENRPVRTERPGMTLGRALLVKLMESYKILDYRLTLLEVQKLAYFQQEAGECLTLSFEPGHYGPYAENLNHVLRATEGHYTRGYTGSRKPDEEIGLLPGAADAADDLLAAKPESLARLHRVADLISGFETPYGMELLASVHWVARKADPPVRTADEAISQVRAWNERKRRLMEPDHVRVAWQRLEEQGWIG